MKEHFIVELLGKSHVGESVLALGWVAAKRKFKDLVFLDLADSTGRIQVVADNRHNSEAFSTCQTILPESSVMVTGRLQSGQSGQLELLADEVQLIGGVAEPVSPSPRSAFDVFDDAFVDQVLRYRHLFLRNERLMAALRFRHLLTGILHDWFREQGFVQVDAPVLTQLPLYDDDSAISLEFFSRKVFLTQCVAFYLESAVCAFEKVYNLGPSFRAEKSKSRRHLAEYWHVKAEIAFADLEDIMSFTERMISYIVLRASQECNAELEAFGRALAIEQIIRAPYPRLTYSEAWGRLRAGGLDPEWGRSFGDQEEGFLARDFSGPFWITGLPRSIEPFPYELDETDPRFTKTADLIAPDGFGELLGVAEKIWKYERLLERMREKDKEDDARYAWYSDLRCFGSIPHSGLGMGLERTIRWLLGLNHVRDAIPFPRLFSRIPYP